MEGTIFEIICLALNLMLWGIGFYLVRTARIDMGEMVVGCLTSTVLSIILLVTAYFPKHINVPGSVTNIYQWQTAIRMTRVSAIEMPLFIGLPLLLTTHQWILFIGVGLLMLSELAFTLRIYKLRNK